MKIKKLFFTQSQSVLGLLPTSLVKLSVVLALMLPAAWSAAVMASDSAEAKVLVTLTSGQTQTQGMALVLANAMQGQGAKVHLLLCDEAGHLAEQGSRSAALAPRDVTPQQMLQNLMQGGAVVEVCALFLPNAGLSETALIDGVSAAQPPAVARIMLDPAVRVFNF